MNKLISSEHVIMLHPERVEQTLHILRKEGRERLHIAADFAKTLTREYINGERTPAVVAQLRTGDYLSAEYAQKAHALYEKFAPFEKDLSKGVAARNKIMLKWWRTHFELLIKSGFNRQVARQVAARGSIRLREELAEFIELLDTHHIPLIIVTATPGDLVVAYLEQAGLFRSHVYIAGNMYEFNTKGKAIRMPPPIVHTHNKGHIPFAKLPLFEAIKDRPNVILLGDGLEDLDILKSDQHKEALTIGFFNKLTTEGLDEYTQAYDIVLTGDGSMEYVNDLLSDLLA